MATQSSLMARRQSWSRTELVLPCILLGDFFCQGRLFSIDHSLIGTIKMTIHRTRDFDASTAHVEGLSISFGGSMKVISAGVAYEYRCNDDCPGRDPRVMVMVVGMQILHFRAFDGWILAWVLLLQRLFEGFPRFMVIQTLNPPLSCIRQTDAGMGILLQQLFDAATE
jgi:hypothetical protein